MMLQTVLIADDSIPLHALIKAQLGRDHLNFHSVYDGAAAVAVAASLRPDLILLDVDMPDVDGFEACRRLKADPSTASIPLLFLTADSLPADKQKALALGAFDYIQKPFKPDQLRARVRSTLQATPVSNEGSAVDPLTGLWNKPYFEVQLKEQYVLSTLSSQPLACIATEIDQLGLITVRYGAAVANQVIQRVARVLSSGAGMYATNCCLSNRRFATLLRRNDRFHAADLAEKLRAAVEQKLVADGGIVQLDVTCSFGVCDSLIASATDLFDRTEALLGRALNRGGNCVAVARANSPAATAA